ncbi:hypothetical protein sos41_33250 [Alphaproteobacteria bacterium SO-S41]|nr:hypothetical protein sos41_33250 [Alphaproteobacteria bacterium SO-S41]
MSRFPFSVMPAQAGIHGLARWLDARLRGHDNPCGGLN